jgi:hypothetical protein
MARALAAWPALLALGASLVGCATSGGLFGGGSAYQQNVPPPVAPPGQRAGGVIENLDLYFRTFRDLLSPDPVVQADAFRAAAQAAEAEPTTSNRLNFALALATPAHPGSDPVRAQRLLRDVLAAADSLLPEERVLATVQLKEVEQRLILDAEAQRLQKAAAAAATQRNDQSAQRLQAALDENRQLRAELDEARAKLNEIMNIERSIREREHGANQQ